MELRDVRWRGVRRDILGGRYGCFTSFAKGEVEGSSETRYVIYRYHLFQ